MNIKELHTNKNAVSVVEIDNRLQTKIKSIRILANEQLKEHLSNVPALLVCLSGEAIYEDENGEHLNLINSDFVKIEPNVKHWVKAKQDSCFMLIK